jgi:hypothetical protein
MASSKDETDHISHVMGIDLTETQTSSAITAVSLFYSR